MASAYVKRNQQTVREYRLAGGAWPARSMDIADWAMAHGKWEMSRESSRRACARDMAEAMAEEYFTDEEGNRVRLKHVARMRLDGEQGAFWGDIRTIPLAHMQLSAAFRRKGIVAECKQLSNDVRYFNRIHPEHPDIQLVLDFTQDVMELYQRNGGGNRAA